MKATLPRPAASWIDSWNRPTFATAEPITREPLTTFDRLAYYARETSPERRPDVWQCYRYHPDPDAQGGTTRSMGSCYGREAAIAFCYAALAEEGDAT